MKIGVLKEIKDQEKRVGLTPENVKLLKDNNHIIYVQEGAGDGAGFTDEQYVKAGAVLVSGGGAPAGIVSKVDIVVKVKEPIESEYYWLKLMQGKILYTFLHLAANKELAEQLMENKIIGISYDTVEDENGFLPMLRPMSVIAGQLAIELANKHKPTLGNVFVVGGGVAGTSAIQKALELGATNVCVYEPNSVKSKQIEEEFYDSPVDVANCLRHVTKELYKSDVIVGAALIKGQKAPQVITEEMVKNIKNDSFIVDISIDQGGCIFGSHPTSHSEPTYKFDNKTYCCIPNLPGQRPREATIALTNLTVPHLLNMCNLGLEEYINSSKGFGKGINTKDGKIVNEVVSKELNM